MRPDAIFQHIHFLPMDENGTRQLHILTTPDWKERLLDLLFDADTRSYDRGMFEYDACINGRYVLSCLDGDLVRLVRFKEGIAGRVGNFEVLCFPHQVDFLKDYLGSRAVIKVIEMDAVLSQLL